MGDFEKIEINQTIYDIRCLIDDLEERYKDYKDDMDGRHVHMVLSKLEEAELLAQRIYKKTDEKGM